MYWYHWVVLGSLLFSLSILSIHFIRLIRLGKPDDYSFPTGNTGSAIRYSLTGAMSPNKKESAYLHLPTYISGIIYHLGTFLSIALLIFLLGKVNLPGIVSYTLPFFLLVSFCCGTGMLIKRIVNKGLRDLSSPDDYISNLLVTLSQLMTGLVLIWNNLLPAYFIVVSILLVYFPVGKLKHALYFFAARYHLGLFFGWRGVWPPKQLKTK